MLRVLAICLLLAILALTSQPVSAQGFMVKPTVIDVDVPAGRTARVPLELRNTTEAEQSLELRLAELHQTSEGQWTPGQPGTEPGSASSVPWSALEADELTVPAYETVTTPLMLDVPRDAHGYYFAAIIAQMDPPDDAEGITLSIRFVVPVILRIQGRPVRQDIGIDDLELSFLDADETGGRARTEAYMHVANNGRSYSRVSGRLIIARDSEGRRRTVTRIDIPERGIIPGSILRLGGNMDRNLPEGKYVMRGELAVDGRSLRPFEKEIAFEGDPDVDSLAYDTTLLLQPDVVVQDVTPGATRTTAVSIENPSDDPVEVSIGARTPKGLTGVAMGDLRGENLSAETWTEIRPREFTIRPRGTQNVRVISRVPSEDADHANYYADLILQGTYPDGQSAGETRSMVRLRNGKVGSEPDGAIDHFTLAEDGDAETHLVQFRLTNTGNTDYVPRAQASVLNAQGNAIQQTGLSAESERILPLGRKSFGGELDLSRLDPGHYALRAEVSLTEDKSVAEQHLIRVRAVETEAADGSSVSRVVEIVDSADGTAIEDLNNNFSDEEARLPDDEHRSFGRSIRTLAEKLWGSVSFVWKLVA